MWAAHDEQRAIDVALKLLKGRFGPKEEVLALFAQEAELSARMHSPHIVRVLDCGLAENDRPFIVFELLDGEDLAAPTVTGRCRSSSAPTSSPRLSRARPSP